MAYTKRILPPEEYHRLGLPPDALPGVNGFVMVIEQHGEIIGRWLFGEIAILEGLEIAESHRKNPAVAARLFHGMMQELRARGVAAVLTLSQSDEVDALAQHKSAAFVKIPGTLWQKDLRE